MRLSFSVVCMFALGPCSLPQPAVWELPVWCFGIISESGNRFGTLISSDLIQIFWFYFQGYWLVDFCVFLSLVLPTSTWQCVSHSPYKVNLTWFVCTFYCWIHGVYTKECQIRAGAWPFPRARGMRLSFSAVCMFALGSCSLRRSTVWELPDWSFGRICESINRYGTLMSNALIQIFPTYFQRY